MHWATLHTNRTLQTFWPGSATVSARVRETGRLADRALIVQVVAQAHEARLTPVEAKASERTDARSGALPDVPRAQPDDARVYKLACETSCHRGVIHGWSVTSTRWRVPSVSSSTSV